MTSRLVRHPVEEEESYFISMTDLMVGLLFIFIIMLMVFALQYREAERKNLEAEQVVKKTTERLGNGAPLLHCNIAFGIRRLPAETGCHRVHLH